MNDQDQIFAAAPGFFRKDPDARAAKRRGPRKPLKFRFSHLSVVALITLFMTGPATGTEPRFDPLEVARGGISIPERLLLSAASSEDMVRWFADPPEPTEALRDLLSGRGERA